MLKFKQLAVSVASVFLVTGAVAKNTAPAQGTDTPQAESQTASKEVSSETGYVTIPAKYLRPNADKKEQLDAVKQMKKEAESSKEVSKKDSASTAEVPRPPVTTVGQVQINTDKIIAMRPGENVFIPISREHPNRILTPFKDPQIVSTTLSAGKKGECGDACVRDGVIYITTDSPTAVTAFVTEKNHEDIAFSITMIPQAIPPREIRFTLPADVMERLNERSGKTTSSLRKAQAWENSQPYVETIREALRSVALGQIPTGYNLRKVRVTDPTPTCKHPGLKFDWRDGQLMEGYNLDIMVGVVKNYADTPVEFRAQNCGGWKTAAVTTWPLTILRPGQESEIYVVLKREDEVPAEMVRKPLIKREFN